MSLLTKSLFSTHLHWAIFCRVVDNHGDLGVCWRLATQLAQRQKQVSLYIDEASALQWMAPDGCEGVKVLAWPNDNAVLAPYAPADVVIEAFGCELPPTFQAAMAAWPKAPVWINLEYFSAEAAALHNHGLPSPVMSGPAKGMTKWFYYPGLTEGSGGVMGGLSAMTNSDLTGSDEKHAPHQPSALKISLFCYEPASLGLWLEQLNELPQSVVLSVTAGRATQAVRQVLKAWSDPTKFVIEELPYLSHPGFDAMLAAQDLNLVRGEDSLIRAIWAGKAFLWQIYPQDDGVHHAKLEAFLKTTHAPDVVVQAHLAWNADQPTPLPLLSPFNMAEWTAWAQALQQRLHAQTDLLTRLESFVATHG
jgi:uncharacterized repeat protein (TIGR03837 family)